jgi:hypothetical protein
VSKPHSGQGRRSTQVQSLLSGMIVMPACYPRTGSLFEIKKDAYFGAHLLPCSFMRDHLG